MKKRWMKILLIINMFLCLFGIQEFASKTNAVSEAAEFSTNKKPIYVEATGSFNISSIKNVHYWNSAVSTQWAGPGIDTLSKKKIRDNLYEIRIPVDADNVIFNDGSGGETNQTPNLDCKNNNYFAISSFKQSDVNSVISSYNIPEEVSKYIYIKCNNNVLCNGLTTENLHIYSYKGGFVNHSFPGKKYNYSNSVLISGENYIKVRLHNEFDSIIFGNGIQVGDGNYYNQTGNESIIAFNESAYEILKLENKDDVNVNSFKVYSVTKYGLNYESDNNCTKSLELEGKQINHVDDPRYNFLGWYTDANKTTPYEHKSGNDYIYDGDSYDLNLYPKYEIKTFTVTFNYGSKTETKTYNYGGNISFPSNPTKQSTAQYDYTFSGIWDGSDGSQVNVNNGGTVTATKDITYTAEFNSSIRSYTVTYHYGLDGSKRHEPKLDYGTNILSNENAPSDSQINFYKISWYFDETGTNKVTSTSTVSGDISVYAKYTKIEYNTIILDLSEFSIWTFSDSYFDMYTSTANISETYTSILNKGEITSLGNKFYEFKIEKIYTSFVIRSGSNKTERINLLTDSTTGKLKTKYIKLTNTSSSNGYKIKAETGLDNLLKAQNGTLLNNEKIYRFTMGATDSTKLYGFEFIFINNAEGNTPASSVVRYWNFSDDSMLSQVKLGSDFFNTTDGYQGYYSLTLKEATLFKAPYDRVLVLACCKAKDSADVTVIKAVEYTITDGTLSRVN